MNRVDSIPVGFLEGTKITCLTPIGTEVEANVETLRTGDLVKTLNNGFLPVRYSSFITLSTPYYSDYGCLYEMADPYICLASRQCTLVDQISDEIRLQIISKVGHYDLADGMNKIPAFLDPRFVPITQSQDLNVWFFSLESAEKDDTYGIYANGMLVESVSLESFRFIGVSPLGNPKNDAVKLLDGNEAPSE
jgi:hypothetical protein